MKKITSSIFVALLIAGASSVQAQDVKKENTSTKASAKTVKVDTKKTEAVKEVDPTMVNPDGTIKEVKAVDKATIKKDVSNAKVNKVQATDKPIKKD